MNEIYAIDYGNPVIYETSAEIYSFSKAEIPELLTELAIMFPDHITEPKRIADVIHSFKANNLTVVAENEYVDRLYRELYYQCYAQMYEEYLRNCVRLTFFDDTIDQSLFLTNNKETRDRLNKALIGTIVLRPLQVGNISTSYINPHKIKVSGYFRTCRFEFISYGFKMNIECFPYSSQDAEMMSCAENAIYNLVYYFGKKYSEYRMIMPLEILQRIETESYQRVFPSGGLFEEEIAKVLLSNYLYPKIYYYSDALSDSFERVMYYYIESGIPFILNLPGHAVTVVGHSKCDLDISNHLKQIRKLGDDDKSFFLCTGDLSTEFIIMDDNLPPYQNSSLDDKVKNQIASELEEIERNEEKDIQKLKEELLEKAKTENVSMIVPLYRRILLDADRAYAIVESIFLSNKEFLNALRKEYEDDTWGTDKNPFIYRLFLCTSHNYKSYKTRTTSNYSLRHFYNTSFMPKMVWVCEITTSQLYSLKDPRARVEILIDATASINSYLRGIMFIRYGNHMITSTEVMGDYRNQYVFGDDASEEMAGLMATQLYNNMGDNKVMSSLLLTRMLDLLQMKRYTGKLKDAIDADFDIYKGSNLKGAF